MTDEREAFKPGRREGGPILPPQRIVLDPEALKLQVIREICNREGHGELVECTTNLDYPARREYICQRGCGTQIFELKRAMTRAELDEFLERRKLTGEVRLRGTVEVS